jgi:steroid delta-isomerase-like uncharacterized protein
MITSKAEQILDDWATAWSSHDPERVLALFDDDCLYEDVTFGAVNRGKVQLRAFANGTFAAVPDFKVTLVSRFVAGDRGGMEWTISGTHKGDFPGPACDRQALFFNSGCNDRRAKRGKDFTLL